MSEAAHEITHAAVLVIGAGPAGLATAACLRQAGVPTLVLEQTNQIASAWHQHYDRLHLHTDKNHSGLPMRPFAKDAPRYPSRKQVVAYMQDYARHFGIQPLFNQRVVSARRDGATWTVQTDDAVYRVPVVVVAAGYNREPQRPTWPGQEHFAGPVLHSADYQNGAPFKGQRVLVVGMGNSGGEIALDLYEHGARSALAVRSPVNVIPREVMGLPFLTVGILQRHLPAWLADALNAPTMRALIGDLAPYGIRKPKDGPITQVRKLGRIPFIDVGTIERIKAGDIRVFPGIERFTSDGVLFTDGKAERFDAVVLATGYRPRVDAWLQSDREALQDNADGAPRVSGQAVAPGLYFCGFYISPTGMLREIGIEAQRISAAIVQSGVMQSALGDAKAHQPASV